MTTTTTKTRGSLVAALVAGLFATSPLVAYAKASGKIHCEGVNACKGKGGCHSAENACKGQNACKGKGWVELSEKDCKAKGGKVASSGKSEKK